MRPTLEKAIVYFSTMRIQGAASSGSIGQYRCVSTTTEDRR